MGAPANKFELIEGGLNKDYESATPVLRSASEIPFTEDQFQESVSIRERIKL